MCNSCDKQLDLSTTAGELQTLGHNRRGPLNLPWHLSGGLARCNGDANSFLLQMARLQNSPSMLRCKLSHVRRYSCRMTLCAKNMRFPSTLNAILCRNSVAVGSSTFQTKLSDAASSAITRSLPESTTNTSPSTRANLIGLWTLLLPAQQNGKLTKL